MALPDFLVIGAMKAATSTLQAQLAAQPGVFMTDPKEPNFFSDDAIYARGFHWYEALFADASPCDLKGESSTHYTKRPTYPDTVMRMAAVLANPKLVYMIRDPLERLVSHYIHEWSQGAICPDLERALDTRPELVDYGRYGMQIAPYVAQYGPERICVTSLERLHAAPERELARIGAFIGLTRTPIWQSADARRNASAERVRRFQGYGVLVESRAATALRRALIPKRLRSAVRARLSMRTRPVLSPEQRARLMPIFASDRAELQRLLPEAPDLSASYPWLA